MRFGAQAFMVSPPDRWVRCTISFYESLETRVLIPAWEFAASQDYRIDALRRAGVHGVTARQVGPLHDQFLRIARDQGFDTRAKPIDDVALRKCVLLGFSDRVARRIDEGQSRCELVHGRRGMLSKESVVRESPLMVVSE